MSDLHLRADSTREGPFSLCVTPQRAGWEWSALRALTLAPGERVTFATGDEEMIVLPLTGSCLVECEGEHHELRGRRDVFTEVTDFVYVPRDAMVTVTSPAGGRFALPSARCARRLPVRYGPAESVPVELRGAGSCSRQVNNFATPGVFECDKLIACEVLTPAGNWSSYPPHKHDECREGETQLEEIYYYEVRGGMAYQRVYGTDARPIDVLAEVRSGDVVLIPHGWHGPSMAVPGYDLYYLNVMAGPGERAWRICDDPAHGWVRTTWTDQAIDPRLPMARPRVAPNRRNV
ncbi:5-deoxy-glucuronate isomerase [Pendulispora rubella]|uniref:5-deoxy-glucuronate isomerase n=1 Tax=Pendulispora rubella TaxID=2741070 RepID=A0ABZ2L0I8_9BACT